MAALAQIPPEQWAQVESLDLDLDLPSPPAAATSGPDADPPADPCAAVDLAQIARDTRALKRLRVRGCDALLARALPAFGSRLSELNLADVTITPALVASLASLTGLSRLGLEEVRLERPPPGGRATRLSDLRALPVSHLTLRELEHDSALVELVRVFSPTLRALTLEGRWAGARALAPAPHAAALETLVLLDTRIGNYALNQIRAMKHLRRLDWTGAGFNDNTPLYLRALPVTHLRCACPNMGDLGITHLRRLTALEVLELPESRVGDEGLAQLARLPRLRALTLLGRPVGSAGAAALGALPALGALELGGAPLEDPALPGLGQAPALERLVLRADNVDDRVGPELAHLGRLTHLDLSGTRVSDALLPQLAGLGRLTELSLSDTRVTRRLGPLSGLSDLRRLDLSRTDLVDDAVASLAALPHLTELSLRGTLVTAGCLPQLARISTLRRLDLRDTVVSPAAAQAALGALPDLAVAITPAAATPRE